MSDRSYQVEESRFSQEFYNASLRNCLKESIQYADNAIVTSKMAKHTLNQKYDIDHLVRLCFLKHTMSRRNKTTC